MQVQTESFATEEQTKFEKLEAKFDHLLSLIEKGKGQEMLSPEEHLAGVIISLTTFTVKNDLQWIIDSGATDHMCCNIHLMHSVVLLRPPIQVALPTGQCITVARSGSVTLTPNLDLHHVLYIPHFYYNLLSISKLTNDTNCCVTFSSSKCEFQDQYTR